MMMMDYIWYTAKQTYKQNYSLKPNTKLNPSKINIRFTFSTIICLAVTSKHYQHFQFQSLKKVDRPLIKTASRKFLNMSTYVSVS